MAEVTPFHPRRCTRTTRSGRARLWRPSATARCRRNSIASVFADRFHESGGPRGQRRDGVAGLNANGLPPLSVDRLHAEAGVQSRVAWRVQRRRAVPAVRQLFRGPNHAGSGLFEGFGFCDGLWFGGHTTSSVDRVSVGAAKITRDAASLQPGAFGERSTGVMRATH